MSWEAGLAVTPGVVVSLKLKSSYIFSKLGKVCFRSRY